MFVCVCVLWKLQSECCVISVMRMCVLVTCMISVDWASVCLVPLYMYRCLSVCISVTGAKVLSVVWKHSRGGRG